MTLRSRITTAALPIVRVSATDLAEDASTGDWHLNAASRERILTELRALDGDSLAALRDIMTASAGAGSTASSEPAWSREFADLLGEEFQRRVDEGDRLPVAAVVLTVDGDALEARLRRLGVLEGR